MRKQVSIGLLSAVLGCGSWGLARATDPVSSSESSPLLGGTPVTPASVATSATKTAASPPDTAGAVAAANAVPSGPTACAWVTAPPSSEPSPLLGGPRRLPAYVDPAGPVTQGTPVTPASAATSATKTAASPPDTAGAVTAANAVPSGPLPPGPATASPPAVQPVAHSEPAKPATPAPTPGDAEEPTRQLQRARELYFASKLDEAEALANEAAVAGSAHWGLFEDSPRMLLADIKEARGRREQIQALRVLAQARRAYEQGKLDEAERLAKESEHLHGPYNFFDTDDRPEKLLAEIRTARTLEQKVARPALAPKGPDLAGSKDVVASSPLQPTAAQLPVDTTSAADTSSAAPRRSLPTVIPADAPVEKSTPATQASPTTGALSAPIVTAQAKPAAPPPPAPVPALVQEAAPPLMYDYDSPEPAFYFAGDVGFALLQPYWKNNPAFIVSPTLVPATGVPASNRQIEFAYGSQFVPQFMLAGVAPNGFGLRLGWWSLDISDVQSSTGAAATISAAPLGVALQSGTTAGAAPTDVLTALSNLRMSVWDLEAMQDYQTGSWTVTAAGGIRLAHLSQQYDAVKSSAAGNVALISGHNFNGAGPTAYVKGRRQLGATGLYLYGDARGALLFGRAQQAAAASFDPTLGQAMDGLSSAHGVLPVAEFELGTGWRSDVDGVDVFAQAGLVGQTWFEAGNASRSSAQFNLTTGFINSATVDHNLSLLGFTFRVGVNY